MAGFFICAFVLFVRFTTLIVLLSHIWRVRFTLIVPLEQGAQRRDVGPMWRARDLKMTRK